MRCHSRTPSPPPPPDPRILKLDLTRELYKEGFLVWGKVQGYSYWPGIVTVDPIDALTVKFRENTNLKCADEPLSHVHFLGYDNQRAWLPGESHVQQNHIKKDIHSMVPNTRHHS